MFKQNKAKKGLKVKKESKPAIVMKTFIVKKCLMQ